MDEKRADNFTEAYVAFREKMYQHELWLGELLTIVPSAIQKHVREFCSSMLEKSGEAPSQLPSGEKYPAMHWKLGFIHFTIGSGIETYFLATWQYLGGEVEFFPTGRLAYRFRSPDGVMHCPNRSFQNILTHIESRIPEGAYHEFFEDALKRAEEMRHAVEALLEECMISQGRGMHHVFNRARECLGWFRAEQAHHAETLQRLNRAREELVALQKQLEQMRQEPMAAAAATGVIADA